MPKDIPCDAALGNTLTTAPSTPKTRHASIPLAPIGGEGQGEGAAGHPAHCCSKIRTGPNSPDSINAVSRVSFRMFVFVSRSSLGSD